MTQKQINSISAKARASASQVKMEDVLSLAGYMGRTRKRGVNLYFQCPNGCDSKGNLDKCSINTDSNLAYCFSCKEGFGPAKLYQVLKGCTYNEGALYLAYKIGDISYEEYSACSSGAINDKLNSDSKVYEKLEKKKATEEVEYNASADTKDLVYRHLLDMPEFALDEEGIEYLSMRGITSGGKHEFFSYTKPISVDALVNSIKREVPEFTHNNLWGVAGFYFEYSDASKKRGKWRFRPPYAHCLGITLRNAKGQIVALQMRFLNSEAVKDKKVNKYFFVTSRGYAPKGKLTGFGASSGSPAHVEYPKMITNPMILIGEGKFKMREAKTENSVALSCQGVGNYSYVVDEVEEVIKSDALAQRLSPKLSLDTFKENMCFAILYDADMFRNYAVLDAGIKLAKSLISKYNKKVFFLVWDESYGKGFDDMKHFASGNGINYKDLCFTIKAEDFIKFAELSIAECDKKIGDKNKGVKLEALRKTPEYLDTLHYLLWDLKCSIYKK